MRSATIRIVLGLVLLSCFGARGAAAQDADLQVTLETNQGKVKLNELFIYKITVTNHGPAAATNVLFGIEGLPDPVSMRCFSCGGGTPASIGSALCELGTLPSGQSETAVLVAAITNTILGQRQVSVTASAAGDQTDPNPGNNLASRTVKVEGKLQPQAVAVGDLLAGYRCSAQP
jgi:hypothetical protein